jgi:uncharacterized coiled-coil protein SlyX
MTEALPIILSVVGTFVMILLGIIGFLINNKLKEIDTKVDEFGKSQSHIDVLAVKLTQVTEQLKEYQPKLEVVNFMEKRIDACFKRIDEQQVTISGLRERSHDMASFMTRMQLHVERVGFTEKFELKPINKKEG